MELTEYLNILRKHWLPLIALTLLGAFAALAFSLAQTPIYTAQSQVFVSTRGADTTGDLLQGANFTVRQVRSYTQLVASPRVLQPVITELGLVDTPEELATRVRAESPLDTVLINVSADDPSPQMAASIANATATSLASVVGELEAPAGGGDSPVQISTVREATVPMSPSSPNTLLNLALGTLLGLALGIAFAILRELLDTRVRDASGVEQLTDAPVLGSITYDAEASNSPLILQSSPNSLRAESFRRLRTNLQFLEVDGKSRALVLTSALPAEGKSTTVVNLAITLAQAGQRVALMDADLRRPAIADYLGLEGSVGLTTVLIGRAQLDEVIQPWGNGNIDVVTSGRIPPNPSELLGSPQMGELIAEMTSRYDVVLIDTSPLLPVTDGAILARMVGGAILVVGAGTVHKAQVSQALDSLAAVGAPCLGVVVNRVPVVGRSAYGYSYYQYESTGEQSSAATNSTKKKLSFGRSSAKKALAEYPGASEARIRSTGVTGRKLGKQVIADTDATTGTELELTQVGGLTGLEPSLVVGGPGHLGGTASVDDTMSLPLVASGVVVGADGAARDSAEYLESAYVPSSSVLPNGWNEAERTPELVAAGVSHVSDEDSAAGELR